MGEQLALPAPRGPLAPATHAVTLWQPYAWCVARGGKDLENRPRLPPKALVGRRLAIAAAARVAPAYEVATAAAIEARTGVVVPPASELVRSALVAVVTVERVVDARRDPALAARMARAHRWWLGPVGIVLCDVVAIEPLSVADDPTCHQGYWRLTPALAAELARREAEARRG